MMAHGDACRLIETGAHAIALPIFFDGHLAQPHLFDGRFTLPHLRVTRNRSQSQAAGKRGAFLQKSPAIRSLRLHTYSPTSSSSVGLQVRLSVRENKKTIGVHLLLFHLVPLLLRSASIRSSNLQ